MHEVKEEVPEIPEERHPVFQPKTPPCEANCPAGHAIQETISLVKDNRFEEALQNIKAENPFPGVCGRVCFHPCEEHCNRNEYDEGVAIHALERSAFDYGNNVKKLVKREKTGKKVAIIGSGPAGMSCAYFLAILGHDVTIYEALSVPGGIPRVGIPEYRLPRDVADREINQIIELGIEVRTNTEVGKDVYLEDIMREYDACFIATGAHRSMKLNISGEDSKGVISGLEFLKGVALGRKVNLGAKVVVIGGGNVAIDAARTAKRLGVQEVCIVCLESRKIMPAYWTEVEGAKREGIKILHQTMPVQIHSNSNTKQVDRLECMKVRGGKRDRIGWLKWPKPIEGTNFVVNVDTIIVAIGATLDVPFLPNTIEMEDRLIKVDYLGRTSVAGIYAGGDATMPAGSVVEAIGSGKRAALGIDIFLRRSDEKQVVKGVGRGENGAVSMSKYLARDYTGENASVVSFADLNTEYFPKSPRAQLPELPATARFSNFDEVSLGLSRTKAVEEAERCFHCGRCNLCKKCYIACPIEVIKPVTEAGYVAININKEYCGSCGVCIKECPCGVISWEYV